MTATAKRRTASAAQLDQVHSILCRIDVRLDIILAQTKPRPPGRPREADHPPENQPSADHKAGALRLISRGDLKIVKGIPYVADHLRRLEANGTFPKPMQLGPGRVAYLESEIDAWILNQMAER